MSMELHDLLAQKDFADLTAEQQQQVLQWCSQEEYQAQRQAIIASQTLWRTEIAALQPPVPNKALQALQEKRSLLEKEKLVSLPWWKQWADYSIPIWKVAAAALLLWCLQQILPTQQNATVPTVLVQQDTIYLERYHTKIERVLQPADTIIKVIYKTIDTATTVLKPVLANTIPSYKASNDETFSIAQEKNIDVLDSNYNKGHSLNQDTFLQELTRQVVSNTVFTSTW